MITVHWAHTGPLRVIWDKQDGKEWVKRREGQGREKDKANGGDLSEEELAKTH